MRTVTHDDVVAALEPVLDPCSVAANRDLSIVDMGLLVRWRQPAPDQLEVTLCLTAPVCLLGAAICSAAEEQLLSISGIRDVDVRIDPDVIWSEARMTERGRRDLGEKRRRTLAATGTRPQEWKQQSAQRRERVRVSVPVGSSQGSER